MRTIGNIERFLVLGIVVVIGAILTVAITGARDLESERNKQVAAKTPAKGAPNKAPKREVKPSAPIVDASGPELKRDVPVDPAIIDALKKREEASKGVLETPPVGAMPQAGEVAPALEPVDGPHKPVTSDPPVSPGLKKDEALPRDPGLTPPDPAPFDPSGEPAGRDYYYEVKKGDTLERIARSLYGDGQLWKEVLAANPSIADSQKIKVGDKLKLPRAPTVADAPVATRDPGLAPPAADKPAKPVDTAFKRITDRDSYQVQKGDTLMSIAAANYGTKAAWKIILAANQDSLPDKDRLKTGMTLKLPAN